jgi:hypothetical protein
MRWRPRFTISAYGANCEQEVELPEQIIDGRWTTSLYMTPFYALTHARLTGAAVLVRSMVRFRVGSPC